MLFRQNTRKARNNANEMSQPFSTTSHCSNRFTDQNLFKYSFSVIQNRETDALQFYSIVLIFSLQFW